LPYVAATPGGLTTLAGRGGGSTNDGGAISADGSTNEWSFWRHVAYMAKAAIPAFEHDVRVYDVYSGRSYTEAMTDCAKQVQAADLAIELHFNAYDGGAQGREAFFWHRSTNGEEFAKILVDTQGRLLREAGAPEFPNRGPKPANFDTRGSQFLRKTRPIACLWEPFFGDNAEEWEFFEANEGLLVACLVEAIEAWGGGLV